MMYFNYAYDSLIFQFYILEIIQHDRPYAQDRSWGMLELCTIEYNVLHSNQTEWEAL